MKKIIIRTGKVICVVAILLSSIQLFRISVAYNKNEEAVSSLKNEILSEPPLKIILDSPEETTESTEENATESTLADVEDTPTVTISAKFEPLIDKNSDFVGWLTVDGTNIDYPVMQSKEQPDLYLRHDFNKEYDRHGSIFLNSGCDIISGGNLIIHGHNMRDGTMFCQLSKFADADFCREEHLITFDTIYGETSWKPILVFKISSKGAQSFPYHTITEFASAGDYIERGKYTAIWYEDAPIPDDARLLTLSTCEYTLSNGRLVVVAMQID